MKYCFLLSSLPALRLDAEAALDYDDFLRASETQLPPSGFRLLELLRDADPCRIEALRGEDSDEAAIPKLLLRWQDYNRSLRASLALRRGAVDTSADLGRDQVDQLAISTAASILEQKTPLEREYAILEGQWRALDLLESGEYFTFAALLIYALRLNLIARRALFDKEKGLERFEASKEVILETQASRFTQTRS